MRQLPFVQLYNVGAEVARPLGLGPRVPLLGRWPMAAAPLSMPSVQLIAWVLGYWSCAKCCGKETDSPEWRSNKIGDQAPKTDKGWAVAHNACRLSGHSDSNNREIPAKQI